MIFSAVYLLVCCLLSYLMVLGYRDVSNSVPLVPGSAAAAPPLGGTATLTVSNLTASQPAIITAVGRQQCRAVAGPYHSQLALARHGIS